MNTLFQDRSGLRRRSHTAVKGTHAVLSNYGMVNIHLRIYYGKLYTELSWGGGGGGNKQRSGGIEDFPLYGSYYGIFRPEYSSYFSISYFM